MLNIEEKRTYTGQGILVACKKTLAANGKTEYVGGRLSVQVSENEWQMIEFKAWSSSEAYQTLKDGVERKQVRYSAVGNVWNGQGCFILDKVVLGEDLTDEQFYAILPKQYPDTLAESFKGLLKASLTEKGYAIAEKILLENTVIWDKFKLQFAARTHHDACVNGLLAHSFKVTYLTKTALSLYTSIASDSRAVDLLLVGSAIHDIGKVIEMRFGEYQTPYERVTHRVLGLEIVFPYKEFIISTYDEKFYYDLLAIIDQHHDNYGEPCRTVYSKFVAFVDNLDAYATTMDKALKDGLEKVQMDTEILTI